MAPRLKIERPLYLVTILILLLQVGSVAAGEIDVEYIDSSYWIASTTKRGEFTTGQDADIMLSGIDFNNTGGPLLFNHPGNIASDGTRLILADTYNNRILIWNQLPTGNTAPDLVLGQKDFITNNPGTGLEQLNWPVGVTVGGGKLVVADTYNDRILVWNSFPTQNDQPADMELTEDIAWPWAVWTDGEKLVVTSTQKSKVLIWNSFPTSNRQADISISLPGEFGTPRTVASDGKHLVVGDHNAFVNKEGTFFWKTFPTENDQRYDFFVGSKVGSVVGLLWGPVMTPDGKLIGISNQLYIWNTFPENEDDAPDLSVGQPHIDAPGYEFGGGQSGDGSGVTVAGDKLYVSLSNGNKVVGFNSMPTKSDQNPDFAIGSPDIYTNTLTTNYIVTNPLPATDGKSLIVISSRYDKKIYVWKNIPEESGAKPDLVYSDNWELSDSVLYNNVFAVAGGKEVYIWKNLPLTGNSPDIIVEEKIGNASFTQLGGIAMDASYFYLADSGVNKLYVWEGIPDADTNPAFSINITQSGRLSSDGNYLAVTQTFGRAIAIYPVSTLSERPQPTLVSPRQPGFSGLNLPEHAIVADGLLFVAETVSNRVLIWRIEDALNGKLPEVVLGQEDLDNTSPAIGRNRLFWPASLAFDGTYLWVGEFKFSTRIVRFSGKPAPGSQVFTLSIDGSEIPVLVETNSTVSALAFNPLKGALRINFAENRSSDAMDIVFPNTLLNGTLMALLDGQAIIPTISLNSTHTTIRINYSQGSHTIEILSIIRTYIDKVEWGGKTFNLTISSNSTISGFTFDQPSKSISFLASGISGTKGSARVTIPRELLDGPFTVTVDNETRAFSLNQTIDTSIIEVAYQHSSRVIKIVGAKVMPESPLVLTVKTDFPSVPLTMNGIEYQTGLDGAVSIRLDYVANYEISVSQDISISEGSKLHFVKWEDGTTNTTRVVSLSTNTTFNLLYARQHYLKITSSYGEIKGTGWYDEGSIANFSVTPNAIGFIVQQVFAGWSGDSTANTAEATMVMDGPKVVTANWRTDYTQLYMLIVGIAVPVAVALVLIKRISTRKKGR